MISASALLRNCGHPRVLKNRPPTTQKEREARARRDEAGARGTTFHAAVETWIKEGTPPVLEDPELQGWLDLLVAQWAPPLAQTETAWGLTEEGGHAFVVEAEPHVYKPIEGLTPIKLLTAGRADVWWVSFDDRLYLVDWKTGKWPVTPPAKNLQVNAAGIALAQRPGFIAPPTAYVPGIYYTRDGVFEWGEPVELGGPAHLAIFEEIRAAALLDETPRPGDHCGSCWERRACAHAQREASA